MYENDYENEAQVTEDTLQDGLMELISEAADDSFGIGWEDARVRTFEDAGVMTYNKGLVITLPDGKIYSIELGESITLSPVFDRLTETTTITWLST